MLSIHETTCERGGFRYGSMNASAQDPGFHRGPGADRMHVLGEFEVRKAGHGLHKQNLCAGS